MQIQIHVHGLAIACTFSLFGYDICKKFLYFFSKYYVRFGGDRYVDLGLGTHRVKCRVHDNFRFVWVFIISVREMFTPVTKVIYNFVWCLKKFNFLGCIMKN